MAGFIRVVLVLALSLYGVNAFATIKRTATYTVGANSNRTAQAACDAYMTTLGYPGGTVSGTTCTAVNGGPQPPTRPITVAYDGSCPANSTVSGENCICNAPSYVESDGACISVEQAACQILNGGDVWMSTVGRASPGSTSCSEDGCNVTWASTLLYVKDKATGVETTEGAGKYLSTPCTYNPTVGAKTDTCPGGTTGEVNGNVVCVPYDPDLNVIQSVKSTSSTSTTTVSTPSGTTTSSTTNNETKDTTCTGDSCTTTTTKTTVNGDGTSATTTENAVKPRDDYCRDNPQDPACGEEEKGSFSGNCSVGFDCKGGDAAMCATAKAVHEQKCLLTPSADVQTEANRITDGTWSGSVPEMQKNIGDFNQSNPFGSTCPGDHNVSVAGTTVVIPFASACSALQMAGNLLVAMTLLGSAMFVLKGLGGS